MLEECGLPYTVIPVNISKGDQFKPEFLAISPNNRMPAIVDHDGPGGRPISVFESGAILQYLGRKTGKFYPRDERGRVEVEQWLFWQMANLGPKAGEANHFRHYAPASSCPTRIERFSNEMNRHLRRDEQAARGPRRSSPGRYSIADMACVGWVRLYERHGQDIADFPHLKRWLETLLARPAVDRGMHLRVEEAKPSTCRIRRCARPCSVSARGDARSARNQNSRHSHPHRLRAVARGSPSRTARG